MEIKDLELKLKELRYNLKSNPSDSRLKEDLFWTLHKWTKKQLEESDISHAINGVLEMSLYQINNSMGYNSTGWAVYKILKTFIQNYEIKSNNILVIPTLVESLSKIQIDNSSHLYSSIFWSLNKLADAKSVWFLKFIKHHGLDKFEPEDYKPHEYQGKKLNSLVLSIHLKAAKIIENLTEGKLQTVNWFLPMIDKLLSKYPNEIWLIYHKSKFLIVQNNLVEARKLIFKIMDKKEDQFWIWHLLGETYEQENNEKALPYFSKAILLGKDEKMLLGVRLSLAKTLLNLGYFTESRTELEKIKKVREENNYKVSDEINKLLENEYIRKADQAEDLKSFYLEKSKLAENVFLDQHPEYIGIVVNVLNDKRWAFIYFDLNRTGRYVMEKNENVVVGDTVKVRISENIINGEKKYNVLNLEISNKELNNDYIKKVEGNVKIQNGKNFGFVDDYFISPPLIANLKLTDGMEIQGYAIKEYNKRKLEDTWKMVAITLKNT